jgi:hypothetical protein
MVIIIGSVLRWRLISYPLRGRPLNGDGSAAIDIC